MVKFNFYLLYDDESSYRTVAVGCTKEQLLDVLSRHAMLAMVCCFMIEPVENSDIEFKEFTL